MPDQMRRIPREFQRFSPLVPLLFLIFLIGLAPFVSAFIDSFFHDYYGDRSFAGLDNFAFILGDSAFPYSLNITVLWALLNVCFGLFLGFFLAIRLVASSRKKAFLHYFLLIPWSIPLYIGIPLWRAFLHGNGGESVLSRITGLKINLMMDPFTGFAGALMVSLWLTVPVTAFVLAGHMRKVSRSVIEAARIDGAGEGYIARYIYFPEIRESLLAMGVLTFIKAFKEFTLVFIMTAGGPPLISGITERHIVGATTTLGVFLYEIFLQTNDWGINAAYALILAALVIFIMLFWVFLKRESSNRPFLILTALVLIPGGNPFLWFLALGYFYISFKRRYHFRSFVLLTAVHLFYCIYNVAFHGFLAGFHPGIIVALFVLILLSRREKSAGKSLTDFPWDSKKVFLFHKLPLKGLGAGSRIIAAYYIIVTVIILYMLLWMSLSRISACYIDSLFPAFPTLNNFYRIFAEEGILRYFLNTFFVAGITAIILPLLIFPAAVQLDKAGTGRTIAFLGFIQIIGIAGGMHSLIPLYRIFRGLAMINTYFPLILIYLYHGIPFSLFILTAYLKTFPSSFRDLAKLEGMSEISYGFRILLPLSVPPLITAVMMVFISGWNGFQAPLLFLNDEELYTISLKLFGYVGKLGTGRSVWNLFAAASVVNTLFIGGLFFRFKNMMAYSPVSETED